MGLNVENLMEQMADAANSEVADSVGDIRTFAKEVFKRKEESLKELALARAANEIDDEIFNMEIEREKKVVEAELLTMQIMTKASAQKAVNAALDIFAASVRAAL